MEIDHLRTLYDYNYWAHDKVWGCIENLTDDQFICDMGHSWGSVRGQVVHLMSGEWVWISRLSRGISPTAHLTVEDFPTRDKIKENWKTIETDVRGYLNQLDNEKLNQRLDYKNLGAHPQQTPIWQILCHLLNHGTDHRAQLMAMLHRLEAPTVEQDMILYFREKIDG
jgi:uncharacterized damage-inducible protein DinB